MTFFTTSNKEEVIQTGLKWFKIIFSKTIALVQWCYAGSHDAFCYDTRPKRMAGDFVTCLRISSRESLNRSV